jgi:methionyl-tRNA formyltransferase
VVFAAGGPIALAALQAIESRHDVVLVVRPGEPSPAWRSLARRAARALRPRPRDPVADWIRDGGIPTTSLLRAPTAESLARLRAARADVAAIATFPFRLDGTVRTAAAAHVLNLHPSCLPRHRGSGALFWTYHAGDADAGATVHEAIDALDAGAIVSQASFALERGAPVRGVHARIAEIGGPLLAHAIAGVADGSLAPAPQDESRATRAPAVHRPEIRSRLAEWRAAHAWHFLAGLVELYRDPLVDADGAPVPYGTVPGYEERAPRHAPGTVVRDGAAWLAWTTDGVVHLAAGPDVVRVS